MFAQPLPFIYYYYHYYYYYCVRLKSKWEKQRIKDCTRVALTILHPCVIWNCSALRVYWSGWIEIYSISYMIRCLIACVLALFFFYEQSTSQIECTWICEWVAFKSTNVLNVMIHSLAWWINATTLRVLFPYPSRSSEYSIAVRVSVFLSFHFLVLLQWRQLNRLTTHNHCFVWNIEMSQRKFPGNSTTFMCFSLSLTFIHEMLKLRVKNYDLCMQFYSKQI